ncbi:hypothetical protein A4X13_0g6885 [Tilletia indica]|uniref:DDE Tnp4 domain-containing protein n=1 Tax=Tilletia indica TaxID=43049 RepID=A0A8T8SPD4_9BASI|nr:hypothetical protein A4X13_0g6885 [Tilletia indica]
MPKASKRSLLIEEATAFAVVQRLREAAQEASVDVAQPFDRNPKLSLFLWANILQLEQQRYLVERLRVPKSSEWINNILPELDDERFRSWMRMDRRSFKYILALIQDHSIFKGGAQCAQTPVAVQLALALHRLGTNGSGASVRVDAGQWGVSEGHVLDCVRRVVTVLASLVDDWVRWPDPTGRSEESRNAERRSGLRGVIGKLDGTDIVLYERPGGTLNGDEFFNRKRRYAINLSAVCNHKLEFTYILVGWPGSVHDSRAWSAASPRRQAQLFFNEGEYLLGDSAYSNSTILVTPYKRPQSSSLPNRRFNKLLSSMRIDIEHAFGLLKGRWGCLKGLRVRLFSDEQHAIACRYVTACVVLHNILLSLKDDWATELDSEDNGEDVAATETRGDENEEWRETVKQRALARMYPGYVAM